VAIDRFPIEAGHILMFARAIGDENPVYDERTAAGTDVGGVIAPPTFTQAGAQFDPDYVLRPQPGKPWMGSGREPTGIRAGQVRDGGGGGTALHAEQHFTYHRPVRTGDVLTAKTGLGESWQKEGRRGGTLHFTEMVTEYRNQDGELVVTARAVAVRTERTPAKEA
jgi:acyl dehydratase